MGLLLTGLEDVIKNLKPFLTR